EYDPQPPFDAGSPSKAPAEVVQALRSRSRFS
ncbi:MAG: DJ-1/PfpI family protein, partial [Solirubrobacterales bacterium]